MINKRLPKYSDDTDYTTNAPSYYDDLARKQKLIQLLAEKIWKYDERLDNKITDLEEVLSSYLSQWDERIENLDDEVSHIFVTWLNDGTLEQIINHDVLGNKADKDYVDELNESVSIQLEQTVNNIKKRWVNVLDYGALPSFDNWNNSFDNAQAFQDAYDDVEIGGSIFIPSGEYMTSQPLPSGKNVTYEGSSGASDNSSRILFNACNALNVQTGFTRVENLFFYGRKETLSNQDLAENEFGTIGVNLRNGNGINSGGFQPYNLRIENFSVGIAQYPNGESIWAGAYHDFRSVSVRYCEVGYLLKDGGTHVKFFGGQITGCRLHGVHCTDNSTVYSNIEFIGTTIEFNGAQNSSELNEERFGIYTRGKVDIKLTNSYLESQYVFADRYSRINLTNTFIHYHVQMFAKNASINVENSYSHNWKLQYDKQRMENEVETKNVTIVDIGDNGNGVGIRGNTIGQRNEVTFSKQRFGTLDTMDFKLMKLTYKFEVKSGANVNTFSINPYARITATGGSSNTVNWFGSIPPRFLYSGLKNGDTSYFEIFYHPLVYTYNEFDNTNSLDNTQKVYGIRHGLVFGDEADFTNENLSVNLYEYGIQMFSHKQFTPLQLPI